MIFYLGIINKKLVTIVCKKIATMCIKNDPCAKNDPCLSNNLSQ